MKKETNEFEVGNIVWSSDSKMTEYNDENQPKALKIIEIKGDKVKCKFSTGGKTPLTKTITVNKNTLDIVKEKSEDGVSFSQQLLNKRKKNR